MCRSLNPQILPYDNHITTFAFFFQGLYVPDYVSPLPPRAGEEYMNWQYSEATLRVLEQYKAKFPWVFNMIEQVSLYLLS